MRVHVGSILHDYTDGRSAVEAEGSTLGELLEDLDRRFPGLRFRVVDEHGRLRQHVRFFVDGKRAAGLDAPLAPTGEVLILAALSGG